MTESWVQVDLPHGHANALPIRQGVFQQMALAVSPTASVIYLIIPPAGGTVSIRFCRRTRHPRSQSFNPGTWS